MRIEKANPHIAKGWYLGPWNAELPISIGFANTGVDEPHLHRRIAEVYLVARGWVELRVERETILLEPDDIVVVEPGEAHTFLACSPDHFSFVLQVPGLQGEGARQDKVPVPRARLGL